MKGSETMDIEARIAQLEKTLEAALLEAERAKAATQVQSVIGRYAFYYAAQRHDLIKELWSKREDASMDIMGGATLVNKEVPDSDKAHAATPGLFRVHALSTPVVEIAQDCNTARGTWISPGLDTDVKDGKAASSWCWIKYGVDFIKEDGTWKLWHLSSYGLFHTDYYTSWGDSEPKPLIRKLGFAPGSIETRSNFIPVERNDWTYAADRIPELDPVPPLPYESWSDIENDGYRTW